MGSRAVYVAILMLAMSTLSAEQLGTTFTFQGQLNQSGQPAQGEFDFVFELFNVDTAGTAVAAPFPIEDVSVIDGLFSVELDFEAAPFSGDQLWLQVSVREGDSTGEFTSLAPRQKVTAAPFSLHARSVAAGVVGGTEVDSAEVQLRVADTCPLGEGMRVIGSTGLVTCEPFASLTHDHDSDYAAVVHAHSAADIDSGTLSTNRFSAYTDLSTEGHLDNNSNSDLLTRGQLDGRYASSSHSHATAAAKRTSASPDMVYGVVHADGERSHGSFNWISRYNESKSHYEITFSGQDYVQDKSTTIITPISQGSSPSTCNTKASGGILIVRCYDTSGSPGTHPFQFVTYIN